MAWMNITCKCGHTDSFDAFCSTPMYGQLPPGQYQCPACGIAWKRQEADFKILRHGSAATYFASRVECVVIDARL